MKFFLYTFLSLVLLSSTLTCFSQNKLPYPIIFVHGLADYEDAFSGTMEYLRDHDNLGNINVFDIVLNADDNTESSIMSEDVKWEDFIYDDTEINIGRRNYEDDIDEYIHEWSDSNLFAINFQEESFDGANGFFNDYFDQSNEAAIFKQGYALKIMIQEVLDYTGAEKVILAGHSMGGMCIREYLQRTDENDIHINWIDPTTGDGHKVARVLTFGTPHLGSNTSPDPTKSQIPNEFGNSEANRDLLYEYNEYTFCDGFPQGIYLFGGNEHCIASEDGFLGNSTFDNVDINCNGSEDDDIIGINESPESGAYNPDMPLPENIKYTYATSIWIGWDVGIIGDGAVAITRQWLYDNENNPIPLGVTDTLLTDVFHTNEGNDYLTAIRGLDEPDNFNLAYKLNPDREIISYITYHQNRDPLDEDVFLLNCTNLNAISFIYNGEFSGVNTIEFYNLDENLLLSKSISSATDTSFVNVPISDTAIYVKIIGSATPTSWENPYKINFFQTEWTNIPNENKITSSIYPNPTSGNCTIKLSDKLPCKIKVYDSRSKLVYESNLNLSGNFNFNFLPNGIYNVIFETDSCSTSKKLVILK